MMHIFAAATGLAFAIAAPSALAATASGHGALALGALLGSYSPMLSNHDKAVLASLLEGNATDASSKAAIKVNADAVVCRASNVDIAAFKCELTFGVKKVELTGRHANELFATAGQAGVPSEGAAGTIYESLHAVNCVIDPAAITRKDGSGASCNFDPRPT